MQLKINQSLLEQKSHGSFHFPLLISNETLSKYDSGTFLLHWHPEIEFTFITKGEMLYKVNNSVIHLKNGDVLFCNSGALHSGKMYENQSCEYVSITFDPKLIYGYENSAIYVKYVKPIMQDFSIGYGHFDSSQKMTKDITFHLNAIISLFYNAVTGYEMNIVSSLQQLWQIVFTHTSTNNHTYDINSLNLSRFRSMISYIELNYSQKITLSDLAKYIHLCESECCRLFKNIMNKSIFDYLQEYRIKKSCILLSETANNISAISEMVGFNDPNHFSKTFKKYMEMTPREYRNRFKLSGSSYFHAEFD